MILPPDFINRMNHQLPPNEVDDFFAALQTAAPISVRYNTRKTPEPPLNPMLPVLWCDNAYYLPKRPLFTADPLFHAGVYYVQEASSMFVAEALQQTTNLSEPLTVLDLCAAPGGKSTLLAAMLSPQSMLIANEMVRTRANILAENLVKWGLDNTYVCCNTPNDFEPLSQLFDVVLVDAPCSGEGMFRRGDVAINEWSLHNVSMCATRQQQILPIAAQLLKPGGILIYTNCPAYINNNMPDCALYPPDGLTYQQYLQYVNATCPNQISVPECYLTAPIFATDEEFMAWITANCNGMAPDNTPQTEALRVMYSMNAAQTNQSATGINNLPTTTIKVSPNPTNAWLNINSPTPITQYTLYDLTGRKALTDNNLNTQQTRIDLSTLPNGLYVLQLTDANQQTSQQKVVLEK